MATPEQWADAGAFASDTRACLLEIRARIEALESEQQHKQISADALLKLVDRASVVEVIRWLRRHGLWDAAAVLESEVRQ